MESSGCSLTALILCSKRFHLVFLQLRSGVLVKGIDTAADCVTNSKDINLTEYGYLPELFLRQGLASGICRGLTLLVVSLFRFVPFRAIGT